MNPIGEATFLLTAGLEAGAYGQGGGFNRWERYDEAFSEEDGEGTAQVGRPTRQEPA